MAHVPARVAGGVGLQEVHEAVWALAHTIAIRRPEYGEVGVYALGRSVEQREAGVHLPAVRSAVSGGNGTTSERGAVLGEQGRPGCLNKPHNPQVEADFVAGFLAAGVGTNYLEAFVCRIVPCESSWWSYAISTGGHLGLAQFAPTTWAAIAGRTGRHDWRSPFDQGWNSAVLAADSGLGPWSCR